MKKEDIKIGVKVRPKFDLYGKSTLLDIDDTLEILDVYLVSCILQHTERMYPYPKSTECQEITLTLYQTIDQLLSCFEVVEDEE